jgi:hypothetical protein
MCLAYAMADGVEAFLLLLYVSIPRSMARQVHNEAP